MFSHADSLRGLLSPFRICYNVLYYDLNLEIDISRKFISGSNTIVAEAIDTFTVLQIDLAPQMTIDSIICDQNSLKYTRDAGAVFVRFPRQIDRDTEVRFSVYYCGTPREAVNPPWDGGFVWRSDTTGKPWIGVACEGLGASSWWPLKDHLSDEPDSMRMAFVVPDTLMAVSNGQLCNRYSVGLGKTKYIWAVSYPINSYNLTLNIADYVHISDSMQGVCGNLPLDYYVLRYNKANADFHFRQVKPLIRCFENRFGPYPFYRDGYALCETPYWGMEHQSCISYGNQYVNNEWGWDYIIVHETGHEWFGNNISMADHADMWIHESFTTYSEFLWQECYSDFATAVRYLESQKPKIMNRDAIQGPVSVNFENWLSADMYYKGSWMLHTLRTLVNDDVLWYNTLRDTWDVFRLKQIDSDDMIQYMQARLNFFDRSFFDQYLNYSMPPILEYSLTRKSGKRYELVYRWSASADSFHMPVIWVDTDGVRNWLFPTKKIQRIEIMGIPNTDGQPELPVATDLMYVLVRRLQTLD